MSHSALRKTMLAATALAAQLVYPSVSWSQTVTGTVIEQTTRSAIPGVAALLYNAQRELIAAARSDSAGRYSVSAPAAGFYSLSFQKTGVETISSGQLQLFRDSVLVRNVEAVMVAPRLATVTVKAKPDVRISGPNSHKYDQFLLRKSLGMGTFLTREQLEARPATQTYQLFQNIPGLKISQHGTQWFIRSQRCPATLPQAGPPPDLDRDHPQLFPIVFIDGFRVRGLGTLSRINPGEIEAIEVYQGAAQLPAEARGNACAAIFVWLKQDR